MAAVSYQQYLRGTPGASTKPSLAEMGYSTGGHGQLFATPGAQPLNTQQRLQNMMQSGGGRVATDSFAPAQLVGPGFGRPPGAVTQPAAQPTADPYQQWMQQQLAIQQNPVAAGVAGRVGHTDGRAPSMGFGATGGVGSGMMPNMLGAAPGMVPPPLPPRFGGSVPGVPMNKQMQFYQQSVDQNKKYDAAEAQRLAKEREERKRLNTQMLSTGVYFPKRPAQNPYLPQMGIGG
jgi:hypothetical protein